MKDPFLELAGEWRREAATLRERYGHEQLARLCETHAQELEERVRRLLTQKVAPARAAELADVHRSTIYRWIEEGRLRNVGTPGSPMVLVAELNVRGCRSALHVVRASEEADQEEDSFTATLRELGEDT